jgi:hypothetical protein
VRDLARIGALVLAVAAASPALAGDVVTLKNGTTVEGRVVLESADKVVVRVGSRDREIARAEVDTVRSAARSVREALERWDELPTNDAAGALDLGSWCQTSGLQGEARLLGYYVLSLKPDDEAAHGLCGHERRRGQWMVREDSKWLSWEKMPEARKDWGEAWKFTTTHYDVRSNLPLREACSAAIELELAYRTFYDWFAADLELYEVVERMAAEIHASRRSFPDVSQRQAYFSPEGNVLFVDATGGLPMGPLIHEATHQLLWSTSNGARSRGGALPAWLDEGLAEYFSWSRSGDVGRGRYSKGAPANPHFAVHRTADKPYDLSRILSLSTGDFIASSKADLKYAQAYTLVHFCMHGDNEKYQRGLLAFLRGAYDGQGSSTDFKKALGFKERDFEKAWHEYARNH